MQIKGEVILGRSAEKSLKKLPSSILKALRLWIAEVLRYGIYETRKIKGYHTEAGDIEIVTIIEINKHRY